MANADDLRNLSKEIENAYNDRAKWISMMYNGGKKQKKERITENKHRRDNIEKMKADFNGEDMVRAAANRELEQVTGNMIADFTAETRARAEHIAQMMADFNSEDKARAAANRELEQATGNMIADFTAETRARAEHIAHMMADLNSEDKARAAANRELEQMTDKMIADFTAETRARAEHMAQMMDDFNSEDKAMAEGNRELEQMTDKMIADFNAEDKARAEHMAQMLTGFRNERIEAEGAWKDLLKNMAAVRSSKPNAKPAEPEVEAAPEPETEPEPELKPEDKKMNPRHEKIVAILDNKPDGLSLANIGKDLGVHFVTLAAPIKILETEGKVEKRDGLYFLK